MLVTPDTVRALKTRLRNELATLQEAMVGCNEWSASDNNAFGNVAVNVLTWCNADVHLLSLAADYNDGISRRNDMLEWWKRFLNQCPHGPPLPDTIKQPDPIPNPVSGLADAAKTGLIVAGVGFAAYLILQAVKR